MEKQELIVAPDLLILKFFQPNIFTNKKKTYFYLPFSM